MQNDWIWFISRVVKYQSLIGAFIGSSLAGLIALYSIKRTYRNQLKLENARALKAEQKDLKYYKGVLTTL